MSQITCYEMHAAESIEFLLHRRLQLNRIEKQYAPILETNGCCSITYGNEFAVAQGCEAVERCTEGCDVGRDIANREPGGRHVEASLERLLAEVLRRRSFILSIRRRSFLVERVVTSRCRHEHGPLPRRTFIFCLLVSSFAVAT
jgi:hypothetical protein